MNSLNSKTDRKVPFFVSNSRQSHFEVRNWGRILAFRLERPVELHSELVGHLALILDEAELVVLDN